MILTGYTGDYRYVFKIFPCQKVRVRHIGRKVIVYWYDTRVSVFFVLIISSRNGPCNTYFLSLLPLINILMKPIYGKVWCMKIFERRKFLTDKPRICTLNTITILCKKNQSGQRSS